MTEKGRLGLKYISLHMLVVNVHTLADNKTDHEKNMQNKVTTHQYLQ